MNSDQKSIDIEFEVPCSIELIFDFVATSENMPLYKGYGLIPGIASVDSSTYPRRQGTVDRITNTDGSSHKSTTVCFEIPSKYFVEISEIQVPGVKGMMGKSIISLAEEWNYFSHTKVRTRIQRKLRINHRRGWRHEVLVKLILLPQLEKSLHAHHREILRHFKSNGVL